MIRTGVLRVSDPHGVAPLPLPPDSVAYPVLTALGYENWPAAASFEALPTAVQFAWAAHRGTGDITEQQLDFRVIIDSTPANVNQSGSWHGAAATNHNFISYYYQGPGASYGVASINAPWQAYLNWVLGIDDGNSNGVWDGTEAGVQSYKYWYVHSRKFSFNSVPHNGW